MLTRTVVAVAALLGAAGCGGSGASSGASVTWKADGVAMAAAVERVEWDSIGVDTFAIFASTPTRFIQIELTGPSPLSPGTFVCGRTPPEALIGYGYQSGAQPAVAAQTCTITLTQVGRRPTVR